MRVNNQTIYYLHTDKMTTAVYLNGSGSVDAVILTQFSLIW
ncbi:hypothetical protein [Leuconostoc mesenteroides]|nr:hypothetical protein [Leuconostoc mesenteroides]